MKTAYRPFGKNLRKARLERKLSLTDVDRATLISKAYLSQLENSVSKRPSFEMVYVLAKFFEISMEDLYYGQQSEE